MGIFIDAIVDAAPCAANAGCSECVQVCPVDIFERVQPVAATVIGMNEDECILCDQCVQRCPVQAVTIVRRYAS